MIFLILVIALIAIAIVAFITWFLALKAEGKCPLCALKQLLPTRLTINTAEDEDYSNNAKKTPIMGWSSWNTLRNHIDEDIIYETAEAMKRSGLANAGYEYINLDDCWQSSLRDSDGKMQGDLETFPSGIDNLIKKINALGLKVGLYSSNGTLTCEDLPASLGNEDLDARTFASWGAEFFKYDFCHHEYINGDTPIIEFIDISKKGEKAFIKLKPEHAKYTGRAKAVKCSDLPSKQGIGYLNHGAGTATFTENISQGGDYVFTIRYNKTFTRKPQYLQIIVNGRVNEIFFPATSPFTHDARLQAIIKLDSGENVIKLMNPVVTRADSSYIQYRRMGDALKNASKAWAEYTNTPEKPIIYSLCEWGTAHPWNWGRKAGNMWRTTHDIMPHWASIMLIYSKNVDLYKYARPGHVNDPDMLEVGNGKLTKDENISHFTLWCMMAAPLVLGNDLRRLDSNSKSAKDILDIVTNKSMILIDQDPLVKPAKRIKKSMTVDILARPLQNGDVALCLLNKSSSKKTINFEIDTLCDEKYLDFGRSSHGYEVHDLWTDERMRQDDITATIPKHGVKAYRISNS